eukprot:503492-Prorocentrum_minimum.AAC.1
MVNSPPLTVNFPPLTVNSPPPTVSSSLHDGGHGRGEEGALRVAAPGGAQTDQHLVRKRRRRRVLGQRRQLHPLAVCRLGRLPHLSSHPASCPVDQSTRRLAERSERTLLATRGRYRSPQGATGRRRVDAAAV